MKLPTGADAKRLTALFDDLAGEIEQLLLGGMTTASDATRKKLDVAFREVSRRGMGRLSVSLRVVMQEVGYYVAKHKSFSARRLSLFANRVWVLARGMNHALAARDAGLFAHLALDRREEQVDAVQAVTLGVHKKLMPGVCAFDFHMRLIEDGSLGAAAVYSLLFPLKPGSKIPPEAMLELDQPQKWKPKILLTGSIITFHQPKLVHATTGLRIQTPRDNPEAKAEAGPAFTGWSDIPSWNPVDALRRMRGHEIDPVELPIELQESVVLGPWRLSKPQKDDTRPRQVYPVQAAGLTLDGVASLKAEGAALRKNLQRLLEGKSPTGAGPGAPKTKAAEPTTRKGSKKKAGKKKTAKKKSSKAQAPAPAPAAAPKSARDRGRLFGTLHYETCRFVLQPLALLTERGPIHLMVESEGVDKKALLKSLKFT